MNELRKAVEMALEALETGGWNKTTAAITALREALAEQPAQHQCMEHGECFGGECIYPATQPAQQEQDRQIDQLVQERDHRDEIIDKLCDAVLGPDRYEWSSQYFFEDAVREVEEHMAALEQPARESAYQRGYMDGIAKGLRMEQPAQDQGQSCYCPECERLSKELGAIKAQQQEPVAYSYTSRITGAQGFSHHPMPRFIDSESWDIKPLYTSPQPSKPLTDDRVWLEYMQLWPFRPNDEPTLAKDILRFARAIESAHGIKEKNT